MLRYCRTLTCAFIILALFHSQLKYSITAHKYAFKFFGDHPQAIIDEQDLVFVVSENLGSIIFVKEFEQYVREIGYSVVLCKPHDPQIKGRVEQAIWFIKEHYLEGREYCEIDSLKSACLE